MQSTVEDYKKCIYCGLYFKTLASNGACLACNDSGNYDYTRIKNYLKENYGEKISVVKISADLNIKINKILKFVEEGKFDVVDEQGKSLIIDVSNLGL